METFEEAMRQCNHPKITRCLLTNIKLKTTEFLKRKNIGLENR